MLALFAEHVCICFWRDQVLLPLLLFTSEANPGESNVLHNGSLNVSNVSLNKQRTMGTCVQAELDCPATFKTELVAHCSQAALGCGGGGCRGERTCYDMVPTNVNGKPQFHTCCKVHAKCHGNDLILGGGRRRRRVKKDACVSYFLS